MPSGGQGPVPGAPRKLLSPWVAETMPPPGLGSGRWQPSAPWGQTPVALSQVS